MACALDHFVVVAPTLEAGADHLQEILGVRPGKGGEHPAMGTHNLLLRLGATLYVEVMAANPGAPRPDRPRWFGVDGVEPGDAPRLASWVARTTQIRYLAASYGEVLGEVVPMSRGTLDWFITLRPDGAPPLGGAIPSLIQWETPEHPSAGLPDRGLALERLEVFHPEPGRVAGLLQRLGFLGPVKVCPDRKPGLKLLVRTAEGALREI